MSRQRECPARPPERKELSNNPVKMCNEIAHLFRDAMREMSENDDIITTRGTRLVLSFLAIGDGVTQLDLVNATHLKAPTVSVILKDLEADGIVERHRDKDDLRILRVYLTEKGRALDRRNIEKIKMADSMALRGLTDEECETLMLLLSRIRDNLLTREEKQNEENTVIS